MMRTHGAVLMLVLCAVAILSILAVDLVHRANLESIRSQRGSRDAAFRRCSDSGFELVAGLIGEGRSTQGYDYLGDGWTRRISVALSANERIDVSVSDESGKLNLLVAMSNADGGKTRKSLARLFAFLRGAEPKRDEAWRDAEERLRKRLGIGVPSSVEGLNRPLYTLDGLREAGISTDVIFGAAASHETNGGEGSQFALCDLLTVFGDGKINLNTAPVPVLFSIDEEFDETLAARIAAWRTLPADTGKPADDKLTYRPFQKSGELEGVEGVVVTQQINGQNQIVKNVFAKVQDRLSVSSRCFSARIVARVGERNRVAFGYFEPSVETAGALAGTKPAKLIVREELTQ
jgi:hypothetical protein